MTKADEYREKLGKLEDWDAYLLAESRLPGPRANLELAFAVADEGDPALFLRYCRFGPEEAPVNSPCEFLAFCGVLGLGRLLTEGDITILARLRKFAADPRWRIREAVAKALQRWGEEDMPALIQAMQGWSCGTPLEQRAAAAALCEPKLLGEAVTTRAVLTILNQITMNITETADRSHPDFMILRKGLGYCWSVAVVALPDEGKALMEKWLLSADKDVRWIMAQNLKKARLARMDPPWVEHWRSSLAI